MTRFRSTRLVFVAMLISLATQARARQFGTSYLFAGENGQNGAPARSVKAGPTLRVIARAGSTPESAGITVRASDLDGLDSLEIIDRAADMRYQTELSRSALNRNFVRFFSLSELFPSVDRSRTPVRLEITVRNTKGKTASVTSIVHLNDTQNTHK